MDMNLSLNKLFVGFLALALSGAVLLCAFSGGVPTAHSMDGMPMTGDEALGHLFHAQELTLANVTAVLFVMSFLFAFAVVATLTSSLAPRLFAFDATSHYFKRKRHTISYLGERLIRRWLSLLEQSPASFMPT